MTKRAHHLSSFGKEQRKNRVKHFAHMVGKNIMTKTLTVDTVKIMNVQNIFIRTSKPKFRPNHSSACLATYFPTMSWRIPVSIESTLSALTTPYSTKAPLLLLLITKLIMAPRKTAKPIAVAQRSHLFLLARSRDSEVLESHCRPSVTAPSTHRCCAPMNSVGGLAMPKDSFLFTKCECRPMRTESMVVAVSSILLPVWKNSRSIKCSLLFLS
mmetsp:Transcript_107097/g.313196  ORF Transcript_107097/g.313196 Transcript_107097/m.313196 type:complete len:213 (+) Transcript_107097:341-979(+)